MFKRLTWERLKWDLVEWFIIQRKKRAFRKALRQFQKGKLEIVKIDGKGFDDYGISADVYKVNGCILQYAVFAELDFKDTYLTDFGPYYYYSDESTNEEYSFFPRTAKVKEFLRAIQKELCVPFYLEDRRQ